MLEMKNEIGYIHFSRDVIYRICADAVNQTGEARLHQFRGRYNAKKPVSSYSFVSTEEDYENIQVETTDSSVRIALYIVVRFGVSISSVANSIIDYIYEEMKKVMGEEPAFVKVIVTGIVSRTIARRQIEFSR